jgi:hypothetical protein
MWPRRIWFLRLIRSPASEWLFWSSWVPALSFCWMHYFVCIECYADFAGYNPCSGLILLLLVCRQGQEMKAWDFLKVLGIRGHQNVISGGGGGGKTVGIR